MNSSSGELQHRLGPWLLGGAVVLVLGLSLVAFRLVTPTPSLDLAARGRVVVLPVVNASGEREDDWLRLGLAQMIAETLVRSAGVEAVDPERLPAVMAARGLAGEDPETRRRARELGVALGAELVVDVVARKNAGRGGARRGGDGSYTFSLEILDAGGAVAGRSELSGADPARLAEQLTHLVASALAGRNQPVLMSRVYSSSPFLNRLYGMGLASLASDGPDAARRFFDVALELQPGFLAAKYRIAECARRQGRLDESRQLAVQVVAEAQDRRERAWERRALRALAVTEALDGETRRAIELATQVRRAAAEAGDRVTELAALREVARFTLAAGAAEKAGELFREVGRLQEALGDRLGRVDTLAQLGALALAADDLDAAAEAFDEGRELAAELGDVRTEMQILASLGEVASRRQQRAAAVDLWRRAARFYEQRGEVSRQLYLVRRIAENLLVAGDLEAAEDAFQEMRELAVEQDDERLEALAALRLTWILLRRGYPYQARVHLDRAIELDRTLEEPLMLQRLIAWIAYEDGNYPLAFNTLAAVRRQAGEAWNDLDEAFLEAFSQALERGERLPLPNETGILGPG